MNALQLEIGRTLIAASQCGQQTIDFIEEIEIRANDRGANFHNSTVFSAFMGIVSW